MDCPWARPHKQVQIVFMIVKLFMRPGVILRQVDRQIRSTNEVRKIIIEVFTTIYVIVNHDKFNKFAPKISKPHTLYKKQLRQ